MARVIFPVHFSAAELACRCGCGLGRWPDDFDARLFRLLDDLRAHVNRPLTVTSGIRCPAHNAATPGSSPDSPHLRGCAVDLAVHGAAERFELVAAAVACGCVRIGVAKTFVHVDVDTALPSPSLWTY